jgi:hypothetical protein
VPLSGGADAERGPVDGGAPKAGAVLLLLPPPLRKRASWSKKEVTLAATPACAAATASAEPIKWTAAISSLAPAWRLLSTSI